MVGLRLHDEILVVFTEKGVFNLNIVLTKPLGLLILKCI